MPQHRTKIQTTQAGNLLEGTIDHQISIERPLGQFARDMKMAEPEGLSR